MDKAFRDPSVLDRPVGEVMEPPMPMVGIGETVTDVVDRLDASPSVLVLDGGHPVGVLTRSDVLSFLAARMRPDSSGRREPRSGAASRRRRHPRGPGAGSRHRRGGHADQPGDTFAQAAVGEHQGFEYGRTGNPTRAALETCLASLEAANHGLAFSSGMAAEDAVLRALLAPGDHVVIPDDAYGGTYRLVVACARRDRAWSGRRSTSAMPDALGAALRPTTKVVWVETPTNPLLNIVDIAAVASIARTVDARVVVDNTFATPYLQQPLALGADVVVHSSTKYLGGHSDVVGGFVATDDASSPSSSRSSRTRSARCRRRSTATSCCAA